jgi:hypothetical protein
MADLHPARRHLSISERGACHRGERAVRESVNAETVPLLTAVLWALDTNT